MNTYIYFYLEIFRGESSNLYLSAVHFFDASVRHLWQLKTVVSLHWFLMLLFNTSFNYICGSLRQLFPCIGVQYALVYCYLIEIVELDGTVHHAFILTHIRLALIRITDPSSLFRRDVNDADKKVFKPSTPERTRRQTTGTGTATTPCTENK